MGLKNLFAAGLAALVLAAAPARSEAYRNRDNAEEYEAVLERSRKSKVVVFGEMHGSYRADNDFVIDLLPDLKKQGFDYLAIEFSEKIIPPNTPQGKASYFYIKKVDKPVKIIPRLSSIEDYIDGKIGREQVDRDELLVMEHLGAGWMELIETAKLAGMKIVRYDGPSNVSYRINSQFRERVCFNNLKRLIFEKDPDARVVVYAGLFHANKKRFDKTKWLAAYLNDYTGGKVLSVSLVSWFSESCKYCDMKIQP